MFNSSWVHTIVVVRGQPAEFRALRGPRQLRQAVEYMRGGDDPSRVSVTCFRNWGKRVIVIDAPYGRSTVTYSL
jgi:hypothetical protein